MAIERIDKEKCTGCGLCVKNCNMDVLPRRHGGGTDSGEEHSYPGFLGGRCRKVYEKPGRRGVRPGSLLSGGRPVMQRMALSRNRSRKLAT